MHDTDFLVSSSATQSVSVYTYSVFGSAWSLNRQVSPDFLQNVPCHAHHLQLVNHLWLTHSTHHQRTLHTEVMDDLIDK